MNRASMIAFQRYLWRFGIGRIFHDPALTHLCTCFRDLIRWMTSRIAKTPVMSINLAERVKEESLQMRHLMDMSFDTVRATLGIDILIFD